MEVSEHGISASKSIAGLDKQVRFTLGGLVTPAAEQRRFESPDAGRADANAAAGGRKFAGSLSRKFEILLVQFHVCQITVA